MPFYLKADDPGTDRGKSLLVLAAKDRLRRDLTNDGYELVDTSFVAVWNPDGRGGYARATGFKRKK